jgi:hypothetical protein
MATIKELRSHLMESQGLKSAQRLPQLEAIYDQLRTMEMRAVKDPFSITLEEIRDLRSLIPDVETAVDRAKAGIKRTRPA